MPSTTVQIPDQRDKAGRLELRHWRDQRAWSRVGTRCPGTHKLTPGLPRGGCREGTASRNGSRHDLAEMIFARRNQRLERIAVLQPLLPVLQVRQRRAFEIEQ